MMVASADGAFIGDDLDPAASMRDQILAAFLTDESAVLIERDGERASLRLTSGPQVVLLTCPAGVPASALQPALDAAVQHATTAIVHVVAVGDTPGVARELKRSAPSWQLRRRFGFHQVSTRGKLEHVTGQRLAALSRAVEVAATMDAPGDDYFAPHLAVGQQRHAEEVQLDAALSDRFPWLTVTLGALCVLLFALGQSWSDGNFPLVLYHMGANSGAAVKAGEVWRVVASMFLHLNLKHIAANLLALAVFGPLLERILGPQRYLLLYGLSGIGGGIASALLSSAGMSVGASGAIWGLMAAGVGLVLRPRGLLPPLRLQRVRRRAIIVLAINLFYSFQAGIDIWAHFGGGIVGFALVVTGLITLGVDPLWTASAEPRRRSPGLTLVALGFAILLVVSLALALVTGRPWQVSARPELELVSVADTGLVVEVPSVLARSLKESTKDKLRVFTYGTLNDTPSMVQLVVSVLPHSIPAEQLDAFMESERKVIQNVAIPNAQLRGDARIVTVGARRFVFSTREFKNRVTMRDWVAPMGDREVFLRVYSLPERPAAWAGIEDKIVASLQRRDR